MVNVQIGNAQVLNVQNILASILLTAYPSEKRLRTRIGSQISEQLLPLIDNDSILSHHYDIHLMDMIFIILFG